MTKTHDRIIASFVFGLATSIKSIQPIFVDNRIVRTNSLNTVRPFLWNLLTFFIFNWSLGIRHSGLHRLRVRAPKFIHYYLKIIN
jgi:hypothetical protein